MRSRALIALLSSVVAASLILSTGIASADPTPPVVVGSDDAGDWGIVESSPRPAAPIPMVGEALAQDLLEASIAMADETTINFLIKVGNLPSTGGWPEITRYGWAMTINGNPLELDGKYTNYSRGACDPTAGSCPPPRDPGEAPFVVRGNCAVVGATTTCEEIGLVHATFDAAAGTITVPVPLELIGASAGTIIAPGINSTFGDSLYAVPSAFLSANAAPYDRMTVTESYTVPGAEEPLPADEPKKKKKKKKKKPKQSNQDLVVHKGFYL